MNSKLSAAKTAIVLDQPFFGSLVCNLKFSEDPTCDTAWTDGTTLGFNPAYIDTLSHAEITGLLCHEVLHCADGHPYRRDNRDAKKWNIACDMAINPIVKECGMVLPQGSLKTDAMFIGKSAEWIYDRLPDSKDGDGDGDGDGKGNGPSNAPGEVKDTPTDNEDSEGDSEGPQTEGDWKEITKQAAQQAKMHGKVPAGIGRFTERVVASRIDWKSALRKFIQQNAKADYSWSRPSTRYVSRRIYLPSLRSEGMPAIAIAVDTSGSIDDVALAKAKAEVLAVIDECSPSRVDVFYADARVCQHDTFERGDSITFQPAGGGGTSFVPVFEAIESMDDAPVCLIYITDLYGQFPATSDLPTLWITDNDQTAPFGETVRM